MFYGPTKETYDKTLFQHQNHSSSSRVLSRIIIIQIIYVRTTNPSINISTIVWYILYILSIHSYDFVFCTNQKSLHVHPRPFSYLTNVRLWSYLHYKNRAFSFFLFNMYWLPKTKVLICLYRILVIVTLFYVHYY